MQQPIRTAQRSGRRAGCMPQAQVADGRALAHGNGLGWGRRRLRGRPPSRWAAQSLVVLARQSQGGHGTGRSAEE